MKQTTNQPPLPNHKWWAGLLLLLCLLAACTGRPTPTPTPTLPPTLPITTPAPLPTSPPITRYNVELVEPAGFPSNALSLISDEQLWLVAPDGNEAQAIPLSTEDTALAASLTPSPNGNYLAWLVLSAAQRNEQQLYPAVLNLTTGELRHYPAVAVDRQSGLAWTDDSTAIYLKAYHPQPQHQRFLHKLDIATGATETLFIPGQEYDLLAGDFALLPSGELLFALMEPAGPERTTGRVLLSSLDPTNDTVQSLTTIIESLRWPADAWQNFSLPLALNPQQTHIAFTAGSTLDPDMRRPESQGLYLMNIAQGNLERILNQPALGKPYWSPDGRLIAISGGIGESSNLWWHEFVRGTTTALSQAQFTQIRDLANPDARPLTYLALSPAGWLDNQHLLIHVNYAFTDDITTPQHLLLTLNVDTGELTTPQWP